MKVKNNPIVKLQLQLKQIRKPLHPADCLSSGNWGASTILVCDKYPEIRDTDIFYQWPMASFKAMTPESGLAYYLDNHNIKESQLCWLSCDQNLEVVGMLRGDIVALGENARLKLASHGYCDVRAVISPEDYFSQTDGEKTYNLANVIKRTETANFYQ